MWFPPPPSFCLAKICCPEILDGLPAHRVAQAQTEGRTSPGVRATLGGGRVRPAHFAVSRIPETWKYPPGFLSVLQPWMNLVAGP